MNFVVDDYITPSCLWNRDEEFPTQFLTETLSCTRLPPTDGKGPAFPGHHRLPHRLQPRVSTSTAPVPEAPVFRPTESEFADPLAYIARIRPLVVRYGICRILHKFKITKSSKVLQKDP